MTRCFAGLVRALDKGRGRLREAVEAVRTDCGKRALHLAAGSGQLELCSYLVEGLRVDVNDVDDDGLSVSSSCLLLAYSIVLPGIRTRRMLCLLLSFDKEIAPCYIDFFFIIVLY